MDGGSGGKQKQASSIFTDRGCLDFMNFEQLNVFTVSRRRNLHIGTDNVFLTHIGIARSEGHTEFNMTMQIYMNEREKKRKFRIFYQLPRIFDETIPIVHVLPLPGKGGIFIGERYFLSGNRCAPSIICIILHPSSTLHFIPEKQKEK